LVELDDDEDRLISSIDSLGVVRSTARLSTTHHPTNNPPTHTTQHKPNTDAEKAAIKKYESKFITLDPAPEYTIDRINNGLYR
jgi:hypothetical protein